MIILLGSLIGGVLLIGIVGCVASYFWGLNMHNF